MNLKPVNVSSIYTPSRSATTRAISVVTMVFSTAAFAGSAPALRRAVMT